MQNRKAIRKDKKDSWLLKKILEDINVSYSIVEDGSSLLFYLNIEDNSARNEAHDKIELLYMREKELKTFLKGQSSKEQPIDLKKSALFMKELFSNTAIFCAIILTPIFIGWSSEQLDSNILIWVYVIYHGWIAHKISTDAFFLDEISRYKLNSAHVITSMGAALVLAAISFSNALIKLTLTN